MKSRRRASRKRRASDDKIERRSTEMVGSGTQAIKSKRRRTSDVGIDSRSRPETATSAKAATDKNTLQNMESQHIAQLLKLHKGNRRQVADALGISERTMYRKLKRYGLT
jgi:transcriptional regulator with PAS, ATPase and Fis domain